MNINSWPNKCTGPLKFPLPMNEIVPSSFITHLSSITRVVALQWFTVRYRSVQIRVHLGYTPRSRTNACLMAITLYDKRKILPTKAYTCMSPFIIWPHTWMGAKGILLLSFNPPFNWIIVCCPYRCCKIYSKTWLIL